MRSWKFIILFLLLTTVACSKQKSEDYFFKFSLDGNLYNGVPAITVSGNNFALLFTDGTLNFGISGLSLYNGVGEYPIGAATNNFSSNLLISQNGLPTPYLGSSGTLKITEVTATHIRGQFNTQLTSVNTPSMTKQITSGEFYALLN